MGNSASNILTSSATATIVSMLCVECTVIQYKPPLILAIHYTENEIKKVANIKLIKADFDKLRSEVTINDQTETSLNKWSSFNKWIRHWEWPWRRVDLHSLTVGHIVCPRQYTMEVLLVITKPPCRIG